MHHDLYRRYGLEPDNAILADERHEGLFEEVESNFSVTYMAGGAGQNSARVAQVQSRCSFWY